MKKLSNQKGFSAVEALLILVIIGMIGFVGWYVWNAKQETDKSLDASTDSAVVSSSVKLSKTYVNEFGKFSLKYPATWKLKEVSKDENFEMSEVTTPTGNTFILRADSGGKGGNCEVGPNDKPFQAGNGCNTKEYLSAEKLPFNDYTTGTFPKGVDGETDYSESVLQKANLYTVTYKFGGSDGKVEYGVGMHIPLGNADVELNKPEMGFITELEFVSLADETDDTFTPNIYLYGLGDSETFLKTKDVSTFKEMLKTFEAER